MKKLLYIITVMLLTTNALADERFVTYESTTGKSKATRTVPLAVAGGGTGASDAATARTNLGLGTIATQNSNNVSITGGSITGITDLAVADGGTGVGSWSNGQLLIGNTTGNTAALATLTAGTGISITNGASSITITNSAPEVNQNLWETITSQSGSTTANTTTDTLTVNGAGIATTAIVGDTLTITATEVDGSTTNEIQNLFETIAVSGQSNVVADTSTDTLTLAGAGINAITTNATTDTITITATEVDGSTTNEIQNLFETIAVSGQSNVVADTSTDTLTLAAGSNVTITTNATTDTVTIAASAGTPSSISAGDSNVTVTDTGDGYITLVEDNSEIIRISGAKVGIGTTSPASTAFVHIDSNTSLVQSLQVYQRQNNQLAANFLHTGSTDPYGINIDFTSSDPNDQTHYFVSGEDQTAVEFNIWSDGSFVQASDARLKTNIIDAGLLTEQLMTLRVVNYKKKGDKSRKERIGFVSQEVNTVFPELISIAKIGTPKETVMLNQIGMIPIIVKVVQEQNKRIDMLEKRIELLEKKSNL